MNISEKIDLLRGQRGISLTHLNKAIGAYRGKITDVKSGKTMFTEKELSILAFELSTSVDYLLGNTDDPGPAGQKEQPALVPESRPLYPPEYDLLSPEDRTLVDNMIRSLAKKKSSD